MHGFIEPEGRVCALFEAQNAACFHCGDPMLFFGGAGVTKRLLATREHLYPLGLNGKGLQNNIVLAHALCNHKRGCQPPTDEQVARAEQLWLTMGLRAFCKGVTAAENHRRAQVFTAAKGRMLAREGLFHSEEQAVVAAVASVPSPMACADT